MSGHTHVINKIFQTLKIYFQGMKTHFHGMKNFFHAVKINCKQTKKASASFDAEAFH